MRVTPLLAMLLACVCVTETYAQSSTSPPPASAAQSHYNTSDTDIGTLLDDPAARAIVDKYIPGFSAGPQIDMARGMTLKDVQQYAPDKITDQVLAQIDSELAKLPVKK